MRMKKLILRAMVTVVFVIGFSLAGMAASQAFGYHNPRPSDASIAFAKTTGETLESRLLAALGQEFSVTTAANAANGSQAISLIFNNKNHDMRLVGTVGPLSRNDYPRNDYERQVIMAAVGSQQTTPSDRVYIENDQWFYSRALPIANSMSPSCVLCHNNYGRLPADRQVVGALITRVPIKNVK